MKMSWHPLICSWISFYFNWFTFLFRFIARKWIESGNVRNEFRQGKSFAYLQIALWLYAGPSVTDSACPTCVCVRPNDKRRNLNALANSFISSKSIPSTTLQFVWLIVGSSGRVEKKFRLGFYFKIFVVEIFYCVTIFASFVATYQEEFTSKNADSNIKGNGKTKRLSKLGWSQLRAWK